MKTMRPFFFFLLMASIIGCYAQNKLYKPLKIGTMEKFDIEDFNKHKNEYNQYLVRRDDKCEIFRIWSDYKGLYKEFTTIYQQYYCVNKIFYSNGIIKKRGKTYEPGGFEIGVWEYFDSTGELIRTEDFDKKYKVNYKQALEIAAAKYGYEQKNLEIDIVGHNWFLENIKGKKKGMAATVDMTTGAAMEYYPSNNMINDEGKPDSSGTGLKQVLPPSENKVIAASFLEGEEGKGDGSTYLIALIVMGLAIAGSIIYFIVG